MAPDRKGFVAKVNRAATKSQRSVNACWDEFQNARSVLSIDSHLRRNDVIPMMTLVKVAPVHRPGLYPTQTTVAVHMKKYSPLLTWAECASWVGLAFDLGRILFHMLSAALDNVVMNDSRAANWLFQRKRVDQPL